MAGDLRDDVCGGESMARPTGLFKRAEPDEEMSRRTRATIETLGKAKASKEDSGRLTCPLCGGEVRWMRSTYNGHTRGACSTEGCLNWIE